MAISLKIDTADIQIAFDLLSMNGSLRPGAVVALPGGATLRFNGVTEKQRGEGERLEFELDRTTAAGAETLAGWLYERLQGRVRSVRLAGSEVEVDREALRRALAAGAERG